MNIDRLAGEGTNLKGRFKESLGDAVGDPALQRDGIADQVSGSARKAVGGLRDFARDHPFATAGVAVVAALALFRGSRGKRTARA